MDCIFCKIVSNEIHSTKIYEDEFVVAFNDITPQAPIHILVIPKMHIDSMDKINSENSYLLSKIGEVIAKIIADMRISDGFRVVTNTGNHASQTVKHLHFHILAGKQLSGRMG